MKRKTVLCFSVTDASPCRQVTDTQTCYVRVTEKVIVQPEQALLSASHYTDGSLARAQKQVNRMRALGASNWLESGWSDRVDISFIVQGTISNGEWYSIRVESVEYNESSIKLLGKIHKTVGDVGCGTHALRDLVHELLNLKAQEIAWDAEGDFYYLRDGFSDRVSAILTPAPKTETDSTLAN